MVQIDREVPLQVARELVAPTREVAHVVERVGGCQVLQAEGDLGRAGVTPSPLEAAVVGEQALELVGWEQNFHGIGSGTGGDRMLQGYGGRRHVEWMRHVI